MSSDGPVINHLCVTGTPFVWDPKMPTGKIAQDEDGLWHVGPDTDLQILLFEVQLTKSDRRFFKAVKIKS